MNKILVVTGGRYYANNGFVWNFLGEYQPDMVIHGGATGADSLVDGWATFNSIPRVIFGISSAGKKGWLAMGKAAGPRRNQDMIDFAKTLRTHRMFEDWAWETSQREIRGLALPGNSGTTDMFRRMTDAGIFVYDFRNDPRALEGVSREPKVRD